MSDTFQLGALNLLGGNPYRLTLGFDLDDAQAITSAVQSLFVDGSLVTGSFSDNRNMKLTVCVTATSRLALAQACDALAIEVNKATNLISWTPSDGLPMYFDTFRGQMNTLWPHALDVKNRRYFELDIPALPFARSQTAKQAVGTSTSVQVGNFAQSTEYAYHIPDATDHTAYGLDPTAVPVPLTGTVYAEQTMPTPIDGAGCMQIGLGGYTRSGAITSTLAKVGPISGSWNLAATTNLTVAVASQEIPPSIAVEVSLGDSHGAFQTFTASGALPAGWKYLTLDLSAATIDLTAITSWTLWVGTDNWNTYTTTPYYLGMLRAYPASASLAATPRGAVYKLSNIIGSARSPAAIEMDRGGNLLSTADASFESGIGSWTVVASSCTIAQSTTQALDGTHSLRLTSLGSGMAVRTGGSVPIVPGTTYTASAYIRAGAGAASLTCFVTVVWLNASGSIVTSVVGGNITDLTSAWTQGFVTATAPATAVAAQVQVNTSSPAVGALHYIDEVALNAGSSPTFGPGVGAWPTMSSGVIYRAPSDALLTTPVLAALTTGAVTTAAPSTFAGTYRILLAGASTFTAGGTVTIQQQVNGSNVGSLWTSNATVLVGSSVNYLDAGLVTLPLVDVPAEASNVTFVVTSSNTNPTEVMFLDTRGFLTWIQTLAAAAQCIFIDAPKPGIQSGAVYSGLMLNRQDATSAAGTTQIDGGLAVEPGDNYLLAYCPDGAPVGVNVTYYPHWLMERTS